MFGFWGKFLVFKAAVDANMMPLAAIGFAASVIGAFYYLKVVKVIYFDEPVDAIKWKSDVWHKAILGVTCLFISPLGYLLSGWLQGLTDTAATALFHTL
jgi:NADH-quinone oxidoreductase subunit N